MYLTRMELDTGRRDTLALMSSPNKLHGMVESAFPRTEGERKRKLWRIDYLNQKTYLMLLSEDKPDLSEAAQRYSSRSAEVQTKDYAPLLERIAKGSIWQFRLVANPTKSEFKKGQRGKVKACKNIYLQEEWLIKRAETNGFVLSELMVVKESPHVFRKRERNERVYLKGVEYEGLLMVTDPNKFRRLLLEGLGRGKAYGMGMMTVMKPRGDIYA